MTPRDAWIYAVLPFVTMAVLTFGLVVVFRQRSAARRDARRTDRAELRAAPLPWWWNAWLLLAIGLVSLLLGIFVWPWLFGFTFVALPFIWIKRPRPPTVDPRTNGHAHRDAGSITPE